MPVSSANRKTCSACGADVTFAKRVRDPAGGYLCEGCATSADEPVPPAGEPAVGGDVDDGGYQLVEEASPTPRPAGPAPLPPTFSGQPAAAGVAGSGRNRAGPAPRPDHRRWWWAGVPAGLAAVGVVVAAVQISGSHSRPARRPAAVVDEPAATLPAAPGRPPSPPPAVAQGSTFSTVLGDWQVGAGRDLSVVKRGDGLVLKEVRQGRATASSQWRAVGDGVAFYWDGGDVLVVRPGPGSNLTVDRYPNLGGTFFGRGQPLPSTPGDTDVATRGGTAMAVAALPAAAVGPRAGGQPPPAAAASAVRVTIDAKCGVSSTRVSLGAVRQGQVLTFSYVSGAWTAYPSRKYPPGSPDAVPPAHENVLPLRLCENAGGQVRQLVELPGNTRNRPFTYVVPRDVADLVLNNRDARPDNNLGSVVYRITGLVGPGHG